MSAGESLTRLRDARLYLCTNARRREGDLEAFLDAVLSNGVDVVQLRDPDLPAREQIDVAETFADAAGRHGALFAMSDRADLAWVVRPQVLHLDQGDLPVPSARAIVGDDVLIGRSTHVPHEVDMAATNPAVDYFCVGPVAATRPESSLQLLSYAVDRAAGRPWFAAGGISADNLEAVMAAGANRVAIGRRVTGTDDPGRAVKEIATRLRG